MKRAFASQFYCHSWVELSLTHCSRHLSKSINSLSNIMHNEVKDDPLPVAGEPAAGVGIPPMVAVKAAGLAMVREAHWYHICIAGVAGGLLAWFIAATFPGYFDKKSIGLVFLELSKFTLGGAIAAMAAVYVIAHTDTQNFARAAGFAALCGVAWPAVISSGTALVNVHTANRGLAETNQQLQASTQALDSNPTPADVTAATQVALDAASKLTSSASPEVKANAIEDTRLLIEKLKTLKTVWPASGHVGSPTTQPPPGLIKTVNDSLKELSTKSDLPGEVRLQATSALESTQ